MSAFPLKAGISQCLIWRQATCSFRNKKWAW